MFLYLISLTLGIVLTIRACFDMKKCIHMYLYTSLYMCIYIHIYTHIYIIYIHVYVLIHCCFLAFCHVLQIYVYIHTHTHAHMHTYIYIYICIYIDSHIHIQHTCIHIPVQLCVLFISDLWMLQRNALV